MSALLLSVVASVKARNNVTAWGLPFRKAIRFVDRSCELEKIFQLKVGFWRKVALSRRLYAIRGTGTKEGGVTT